MRITGKIFRQLSFILIPLYKWYSSKDRNYHYKELNIRVDKGVFHPGFFFSSKHLVRFLETLPLRDKTILELGCGTGLVGIAAAKNGAIVTLSDISKSAVDCAQNNTKKNKVNVTCIQSDLFAEFDTLHFDYILVNPPYYPDKPKNSQEMAWYCGTEFEYFKEFFSQLKQTTNSLTKTYMVLSEFCQIDRIQEIGIENGFKMEVSDRRRNSIEESLIYQIVPIIN